MSLDYLADHSRNAVGAEAGARTSRTSLRHAFGAGQSVCGARYVVGAYYATRSRSLKKANNLAANRLRKAGNVEVHGSNQARDAADVARAIGVHYGTLVAQLEIGHGYVARPGRAASLPPGAVAARACPRLAFHLDSHARRVTGRDGISAGRQRQRVRAAVRLRRRAGAVAVARLVPQPPHHRATVRTRSQALLHGPGRNAYKAALAGRSRPVLQLRVYANSLRAHGRCARGSGRSNPSRGNFATTRMRRRRPRRARKHAEQRCPPNERCVRLVRPNRRADAADDPRAHGRHRHVLRSGLGRIH